MSDVKKAAEYWVGRRLASDAPPDDRTKLAHNVGLDSFLAGAAWQRERNAGRIADLEKALREILEAGTEEVLDDNGKPRPWENYLLYREDVSRYWSLLEQVTPRNLLDEKDKK